MRAELSHAGHAPCAPADTDVSTVIAGSSAVHQPPEDRGGPLPAHTLLAGRNWVEIEHNGQRYRLQTTRAGKLILTK